MSTTNRLAWQLRKPEGAWLLACDMVRRRTHFPPAPVREERKS
jgi:hypothetical protein